MPEWLQGVLPVVTLVIGAGMTYWTEGRREAKRADRERAMRAEERRQALADRRQAFELEHLLRARDALRVATGAAAAQHHAFARQVMAKGFKVDPRTLSMGEEHDALDAATVQALGELQSAMVLVLDDNCRELIRRAGAKLREYGRDERGTREAVAEAMQAIGERVRVIHADL